MINVVFQNLEKSQMTKEIVAERIGTAIERFPDLQDSDLVVTVTMENSPTQAGPDVFGVKVRSKGGRYGGILLKKSASNLYAALAEVCDYLLERLNRFGDRKRVKSIQQMRRLIKYNGEF